MFIKNCAPCHGPDGRARTPAARKLAVKDLTLSQLPEREIPDVLRKGRFDVDVREVPAGTTVSGIARKTRIPEKEIGIVLVNGRHAGLSKALSDGDTVAIFPLVGGG